MNFQTKCGELSQQIPGVQFRGFAVIVSKPNKFTEHN